MSAFLTLCESTIKNTGTAENKGYDAGKRVAGIKRHIAVDSLGLPHVVAVTTAEVTDRTRALQVFERCRKELGRVQSLLCDGSYVVTVCARRTQVQQGRSF